MFRKLSTFPLTLFTVKVKKKKNKKQNTEYKVLTKQNTMNEGCNFLVVSEIVSQPCYWL